MFQGTYIGREASTSCFAWLRIRLDDGLEIMVNDPAGFYGQTGCRVSVDERLFVRGGLPAIRFFLVTAA